jgi:hypothetical protein
MRRVAKALPYIFLAVPLCGCADYFSRQSAQLQAAAIEEDDAKCRSYGVQPGTPPYVQCRMNLENGRDAIAAAAVGAFFANGGVGGNR